MLFGLFDAYLIIASVDERNAFGIHMKIDFLKTSLGLAIVLAFNQFILNSLLSSNGLGALISFVEGIVLIALYTILIFKEKMSSDFKTKVSLLQPLFAMLLRLAAIAIGLQTFSITVRSWTALVIVAILLPLVIALNYLALSCGNWLGLYLAKKQ